LRFQCKGEDGGFTQPEGGDQCQHWCANRLVPSAPDESAEVSKEGRSGQDKDVLTSDECDSGERHEQAEDHQHRASPDCIAKHSHHDRGDRRLHRADR
jgi:hypothetical protein